MNWQRVDHWHMVSDCGRYSISRSYDSTRDTWTYQAWHIRRDSSGKKTGMPRQLSQGSKDVAIEACETHANQREAQT